jgi:hypothetical protein
MKSEQLRRKLGKFELAETLSDEHSSFNVAGILFLENGPTKDTLRNALDKLQQRHPLLRVKILKQKKKHNFDSGSVSKIPLEIVERGNEKQWESEVESSLNTRLDTESGPLIRVTYLLNSVPNTESELILTCHHSIVDAASMLTLYKELLGLCSKMENGESLNDFPELPLLPPEEAFFPPLYRGLSRKWHTMGYLLRQMGDEIGYRLSMRGNPKAEIPLSGQCRILPLTMPAPITEKIIRASRRRKIGLNSLLTAGMLQAVANMIYKGHDLPLRYFTFADLRPYLKPPVPEENLGTYHSMLRSTIQVKENQDIWDLAGRINQQNHKVFKRGDKFISPLLSPQMMSMIIRLKSMRMGTTALSYQGSIKLPSSFGRTRVTGIRGYISNFSLGPLYTAAVRLFNKEFLWDILYLDSDMDLSQAQSIANEILGTLEAACR